MNSLFKLSLLSMLAVGLIFVAGCDKDADTATGGNGLIQGDTADFAFQEIEGLFSENDIHESFTVSADIAFDLLDAQFPDWDAAGRGGSQHQAASFGDSLIIEVANYTYTNGWHVFSFGATVFKWHLQVLTEYATLTGIDSIQVLAGGQPMVQPDSTADTFNVRAHFEWDLIGGTDSFTAHHSLSMVADYEKLAPDMTVNASLSQNHTGTWHLFPETDSAATCALDFDYEQTVINLVYLYDDQDNLGDCPVSGSMSVDATVDLVCEGATSGNRLAIEGTWNVDAVVQDNNEIAVTYSDGTTSWSATDTCQVDVVLALPGFGRH